jgi:hypothetical protein
MVAFPLNDSSVLLPLQTGHTAFGGKSLVLQLGHISPFSLNLDGASLRYLAGSGVAIFKKMFSDVCNK